MGAIISAMNALHKPITHRSITALCCIVFLASSEPPLPTTKLCELMRIPENYNGKLVKVRATWVYGYEWSYVHCLDCDERVWLDTSELDERSEKMVKHAPKYSGIVNIDVEGIFQAGGTFGHMNGYKYQLKAHTINNPAVISRGMKAREKELEIERKFACGGKTPR
jgi:hypothetical protein